MNYLAFTQPEKAVYPIVFLVPVIREEEIRKAYINPHGINPDDCLCIDLHYSQEKKKTPVKEIKAYLNEMVIPALVQVQAKYVVVADSEYFKALTGVAKVDVNIGYVLPSTMGDFNVLFVPNYRQIFYDPDKIKTKIAQGMQALNDHFAGDYNDPGKDIIKFAAYPKTLEEIRDWLRKILDMNCPVSADIEAFSLKHTTAGIGTICLCWSQSEGIAFPVDLHEKPTVVRQMLVDFFIEMKQRVLWHNISYDVYVLIYQLFMSSVIDTEGLLDGMDIMLSNWDDTKLITYLATNSVAGNKLSLKEQAQEYAGNYAQEDIKDILKIPLDDLLRYNLVDGLSTWYVYNKHWGRLVEDQQLEIYETIFKPAINDIIQMQLTGMPVNMTRVYEVKAELEKDNNKALTAINSSFLVQKYTHHLNEKWVKNKNETLKKKRVTLADAKEVFNPNSGQQVQGLLYEMIGLPVISKTDAGQPSTDADTLKALKNRTKDPMVLQLLDDLLDLAAVRIVLSTFIPALLNSTQGPDGWHYQFGNFNLGGTLSARLSSSDPNLQNIPASSKYGKLIKSCYQAPPGWLFVGLDFASLEDRISALTTKDPNKLKVYTDGYDGHCLRAYAYFGDRMPDIDPTSVESINSIQDKYKPERQDSKAPTFALTYQGTYFTLIINCGFTEQLAKYIEAQYRELYDVSIQWIEQKLEQASVDGYVTAAFGLRVRTPLLKQVIRGNSKTPYEASAEGRSAGNALGQSWCLLNSRAASEFLGKVRRSKHKLDIRPCAQIHDASYYLIRNDIEVVEYTNEHLVKAVKWQDHPDIYHDEVKLGGELSIFYPSWEQEMVIPNAADRQTIFEKMEKHIKKYEL